MPKIAQIKLRCLRPDGQTAFYRDILGMTHRADGTLGYGTQEAGLIFEEAADAYAPNSSDIYWKIALAVPNIERACEQLADRGVQVTAPRQFQDVGYLAHFEDPAGFKIELIEHWFKGNRPEGLHDPSRLGGGPTLSLLTLRTNNITPHRVACLEAGMTALSVQPVTDFGFTLYFFAFTDETPPDPDLTAVKNREWLYQRPYTILEFQEVHDAPPMRQTPGQAAGYVETRIDGLPPAHEMPALSIYASSPIAE